MEALEFLNNVIDEADPDVSFLHFHCIFVFFLFLTNVENENALTVTNITNVSFSFKFCFFVLPGQCAKHLPRLSDC